LDFSAKTAVGTSHIVSPKIRQGGSSLPKKHQAYRCRYSKVLDTSTATR
jgi:hypothetical protein